MMEFKKDDNGEFTFSEGGESVRVGDLEKAAEQSKVAASDGRALVARLRARRHSLIEEHEIEGVKWYLLKMNEPRVSEVAVRTMQLGDGSMILRSNEVLHALVTSTLQVGVVSGPNDPTPFFNPAPYLQEDAYGNTVETTEIEQALEEPDFDLTAASLFDLLTDMNPAIFPQKKMVMAAGQKLLDQAST